MFIDTSALIAILAVEIDRDVFSRAIQNTNVKFISGLVRLEAIMVLTRINRNTPQKNMQVFDQLVQRGNIECIDLSHEISTMAIEAFSKFGKGRGHPAQLNLSDCMSYAAAKYYRLPLLCKGDDFAKTDIALVTF